MGKEKEWQGNNDRDMGAVPLCTALTSRLTSCRQDSGLARSRDATKRKHRDCSLLPGAGRQSKGPRLCTLLHGRGTVFCCCLSTRRPPKTILRLLLYWYVTLCLNCKPCPPEPICASLNRFLMFEPIGNHFSPCINLYTTTTTLPTFMFEQGS